MLITEIARKARVSPATVSRAINQPQLVAPGSLARIREVMVQHNYVPAPVNRRRGPKVKAVNRRRIGVWFVGARANNPSLHWFQEHLMEISSADTHYQVDLKVLFSPSPAQLPRDLANAQLDGVIIQGREPSPECLGQLRELPSVWFMTRRSFSFPGDYVEPNNEENGQMAADYLKAQGHKAVAIISSDPDYSAIVRRNRAFVERAREHNLPVHTILGKPNAEVSYLELAPIHGESEDLVRRLLQCNPKPTGLYLPADHFCGAFFRAMREAGRKAGRDFEAILGNYNPVIYHNLDHSPAAIDVNLSLLIRKVIDHLFWRIENPNVSGRTGITISPWLRLPTPGRENSKPFGERSRP